MIISIEGNPSIDCKLLFSRVKCELIHPTAEENETRSATEQLRKRRIKVMQWLPELRLDRKVDF